MEGREGSLARNGKPARPTANKASPSPGQIANRFINRVVLGGVTSTHDVTMRQSGTARTARVSRPVRHAPRCRGARPGRQSCPTPVRRRGLEGAEPHRVEASIGDAAREARWAVCPLRKPSGAPWPSWDLDSVACQARRRRRPARAVCSTGQGPGLGVLRATNDTDCRQSCRWSRCSTTSSCLTMGPSTRLYSSSRCRFGCHSCTTVR